MVLHNSKVKLISFKQFFAVRPEKIASDIGAAFVARAFSFPNHVAVVLLKDAATDDAVHEKLNGMCKKHLFVEGVNSDNLSSPAVKQALRLANTVPVIHGDLPFNAVALYLLAEMQQAAHRSSSVRPATETEDQDTEIQRLHDMLAKKQLAISDLQRQVLRFQTMRARPAEQSADAWAQLQDKAARLEATVEALRSECDQKIQDVETDLMRKNDALVRVESALNAREQDVAALRATVDRQNAELLNKREEFDALLQDCGHKATEIEMLQSENERLAGTLQELHHQMAGERERDVCIQQFEQHLVAIRDHNRKIDMRASRETRAAVAAMQDVHIQCEAVRTAMPAIDLCSPVLTPGRATAVGLCVVQHQPSAGPSDSVRARWDGRGGAS